MKNMWIARNKYGNLWLYRQKPFRMTEDNYGPHREPSIWYTNDDADFECALDTELFPGLKWEDEPIEVSIETVHELKETYKELINLQTKQINNLTRVFRGMPLEEVSETIKNTEERIYEKYKMIGNPLCSQSTRGVTIANHHSQIGDNSLREYIVDDKVMVTIYVRRNDFNNADILVTDFGDKYKMED